MNSIATSLPEPTPSMPPGKATPGDATPATNTPASPFVTLLAALDANNNKPGADDATTAPGADVAATDMLKPSAAPSADVAATPVAPSHGRHHDASDSLAAFAFGVPVTIAAIPVASLTAGATGPTQSTPAVINAAAPLKVSDLAAPSSPPVPPSATTANSLAMPAPALSASGSSADRAAAIGLAPLDATIFSPSPIVNPPVPATNVAPTPATLNTLSTNTVAITTGAPSATTTVVAATPAGPASNAAFTMTPASAVSTPTATLATTPAPTSVAVANTLADAATTAAIAAATAPAFKVARHSAAEDAVATIGGASGATTSSAGVVRSATAPAAALPHPAVASALPTLVTQATLLHNGQAAEMRLRLRPPDLGDVRVILRRDATGALSAHLIPATREAGDVLNANLHHLRDALAPHSQGQGASVSVGQRDVADQRQQMYGGHASHEDETSAANPATPATNGAQPSAPRTGRAVAASATVDYDA